jgi:predicted GIY-YIG superfamily endonuclease
MCKKLIKELKKGMILSDIKDVFKTNFMKTKGVDIYLDLEIIKDVEGQYVYEIINNINGKKYIGRTKNPIRRIYEHIHQHTNQEFKQDLYKYGLNNFIFKCKISLDMIQEEIELINKNNNLYNKKIK